MSTGQATTRAHDRDRAIRTGIEAVADTRWRSAPRWMDLLPPSDAYRLVVMGRAQVGNVLREMVDLGLMEHRVPKHDRRGAEFRRAPHTIRLDTQ